MKRATLLFLISCLSFNFSLSQSLSFAKEVIDTLCSKEMYGRGYIDNGDKKAANFIENEFKKIGLESYEKFQQSFSFDINTFPKNQSISINNKKLVLGVDYIISPNSGDGSGKAKLIPNKKLEEGKKGHKKGIIMSKSEYKDFLLTGKYTKDNNPINSKIIVRTNEKKLTASLSRQQLPIPIIEVFTPNLGEIKKIKFDINAELKEQYQSQNVIGYIEGTTQPDSILVFSAHYDHLGGMGEIYFPGANDNAAGIAMLLDLAKYYKENPSKYTTVFIAFGGEEAGLIGSKHFVENPLFELKKIKFLMNMDLVGTGEEGITAVNGSVFKEHFSKLVSINDEHHLLPVIKSRGKAANSDHYFFSEQGVPSFFIYAMGDPKHYHDIHDNGSDLELKGYNSIKKLVIEFSK